MADFQEVMKQARRLCKESGDCHCCPLYDLVEELVDCPFLAGKLDAKTIEETVTKWAAEHPELRYPSWEEWWRREFPDADNAISPCTFGLRERFACFGNGCETCRAQPIPADIAEKLGIKPIGGETDENAR